MASAVPPTSFKLPAVLEPTVDVILKSSDGVEFRAHRSYLAAASTAFEGMFLLPQTTTTASNNSNDSAATIELAESAIVIKTLLQYIYPGARERPESLDVIKSTLAAAAKYDMTTVVDSMRLAVMGAEHVRTSPLAVYDICCSMHFEPEADVILHRTYHIDEDTLFNDAAPHLHFVKILQARRIRARKILKLIEAALASRECPSGFSPPYCRDCRELPSCVKLWARLAEAEILKKPTTEKIFSMAFFEEIRLVCPSCRCAKTKSSWNAQQLDSLRAWIDSRC